MTWEIVWSEPALRDLRRLDAQVARRVASAVAHLAETGQGDVVALKEPLRGFRLRMGDWCITFERDPERGVLTVRRVRHRREAYRRE